MEQQIRLSDEDLGIDDPEAYRRETRARLRAAIDEEAGTASSEHEAAIESIRDPTDDELHPVTLGEQTLRVKNYINGPLERKVRHLARMEDSPDPDIDLAREHVIDIMTWLIETPTPYDEREVWREYAERYGTVELQRRALEVAGPYFDQQDELKDVDSFRGE